ncbi:RNase adapter RapZ [Agaribacterium haliotis]|uniref:RNase adapter RapZ n=1 Tax=Agaribacterium haliotis TaxID=2013869 RepID=UPI000BB57A72|nr:RNase adapter RapZ [Agaribacterium haliotis]
MQILVISGRSGSGKTTALHLLEDEGYTCIDNLPVSLIPALLEQVRARANADSIRLAIGIDSRNIDGDLSALPSLAEELERSCDHIKILYLDTSKEVLLRRFSETRRKHPLSDNDTGLREAISEEDLILAPIAALADVTIDTSGLNLHELRSAVKRQLIGSDSSGIAISLTSFGFKFGIPVDSDFLFDVRCLPNPYWRPELRSHSGLEPQVIEFLRSEHEVQAMADDIESFAKKWIPSFENNNRSYLNIAIGCTGGMHRSVYLAEHIADKLRASYKNVQTRHRQLELKKP